MVKIKKNIYLVKSREKSKFLRKKSNHDIYTNSSFGKINLCMKFLNKSETYFEIYMKTPKKNHFYFHHRKIEYQLAWVLKLEDMCNQ